MMMMMMMVMLMMVMLMVMIMMESTLSFSPDGKSPSHRNVCGRSQLQRKSANRDKNIQIIKYKKCLSRYKIQIQNDNTTKIHNAKAINTNMNTKFRVSQSHTKVKVEIPAGE